MPSRTHVEGRFGNDTKSLTVSLNSVSQPLWYRGGTSSFFSSGWAGEAVVAGIAGVGWVCCAAAASFDSAGRGACAAAGVTANATKRSSGSTDFIYHLMKKTPADESA